MFKKGLEVSDLIDRFLPQMDDDKFPMHHLRTLSAISRCRTASLGSHILVCDKCGHEKICYNSCKNRHCPKCQGVNKESWIIMQEDMLLPVTYYHVVFTIPHELNILCMYDPGKMYNLLFKSAWQTLDTLSKDVKWLGAQGAATMVLHTWSQTLGLHPHLHCIVPGGGIDHEGNWHFPKKGKHNFLFPVVIMNKIFRAIFLKNLNRLVHDQLINLPPQYCQSTPHSIKTLLKKLYEKEWVVYTKKPFAGVKHVIDYLGRYSHRVAITNNRIIDVSDDQVIFSYKDYKDGARRKTMSLQGSEFLRRFCLHILPPRFRKVRQYGFTANACKQKKINQARIALGVKVKTLLCREERKQKAIIRLIGQNQKCPCCPNGQLIILKTNSANRGPPDYQTSILNL